MENFRYDCECDKLSVSVSSCNEYDSVILGDSSRSPSGICLRYRLAWGVFFNKQTEESVFSSVIGILSSVAAFIFVGAWMPFREFYLHSGTDVTGAVQVWRLVVLAILVLLLRRLPDDGYDIPGG
jgi:hypothetical protein